MIMKEFTEYRTALWTYKNYLNALSKIDEVRHSAFVRVKDIVPFPSEDDYTDEEKETILRNQTIIDTFKEQNPFKVVVLENIKTEIGFYPNEEIAVAVADLYYDRGYSTEVYNVTTSYAGDLVYTNYIDED